MNLTQKKKKYACKTGLLFLLVLFCILMPAKVRAEGRQTDSSFTVQEQTVQQTDPSLPAQKQTDSSLAAEEQTAQQTDPSLPPQEQTEQHPDDSASAEKHAVLQQSEDSIPAQEDIISEDFREDISFQEGELPSPQAETQNGLVLQGGHYLLYADGKPVTEPGWKELPDSKFYVDNQGYVTAKMEESGSGWRFFKYNAEAALWEKQTELWETVLTTQYYFDTYGNCTMIYNTKTQQLSVSSGGQMLPVKQSVHHLSDNRPYYFSVKGIRQTSPGWKKLSSSELYLVGKKGHIISKMIKSGNIWRYYAYDFDTASWNIQKDVWQSVKGKDYYFGASGKCTKIYNPNTKKCKKLSKGKMTAVKKEISRLSDGKLYYFNSKGLRITKKGWQKSSASLYVQIGKKGYVTCKMEKKSGYWRFSSYSYSKDAWQKQKKVWKTVNNQRYYFNGSGKGTHQYDPASGKFYDLGKNKKTLVINDIRSIKKKKYYFGPDGVKMNSAGLYLTAFRKLIYVKSNGQVEKEISGELLAYTAEGSRITSCRIRDSHFMCYYNADGVIIRQIDLEKPMVALTYDDGPSPYTSAILDLLEQHGSAATFFVVGQRVNSYPDILRRACSLHCEIGNHTYSHQILTKIGISEIQSQVNLTNDAVRSITGVSPVVMRPPGGGHNGTVDETVGMPLILWSIDTLDWRTRNAARTQAAVLGNVSDGDIVLMHDLYQQTAEASSVIIPELVRQGYQLITVSELADCRGGMAAGGVYRQFR